jgi:hypothetical protein
MREENRKNISHFTQRLTHIQEKNDILLLAAREEKIEKKCDKEVTLHDIGIGKKFLSLNHRSALLTVNIFSIKISPKHVVDFSMRSVRKVGTIRL